MADLSEVQWLLFDLDNTLLDFDEGANIALKETFSHFGYFDRERELWNSYWQINHQCWQQFEKGVIDVHTLKEKRFSLFVELNELRVDHRLINNYYLKKLSEQIKEVEGARTLLDSLHGKFSLVLATNGFSEVQYPRIKQSALEPYFTHIIVSEEIGHSKPSSGFFDYAFEKMDTPNHNQVMIIGDSLSSDIRGGTNYGIRTCWFNRNGASNPTDIMPDFTVQSLEMISRLWQR